MNDIMTVLGPVNPSALGVTMMHEHLILDHESSYRGGFIARLEDVDVAVDEVAELKRLGGQTLVELTTGDIGRDPSQLKKIASRSGLNIVASTGYYAEPVYRQEVFELTIDRLAERMIAELDEGIGDTGIRAGIIGELGTFRRNISPAEERVFRAAARAQVHTGVAISTHTYWGGELALEQVAVLRDEGVEPDRIIVGHLGDRRTIEHYTSIGKQGVFLQFDHIGKTEYLADVVRAEMLAEMVRRGFADQLLISSDISYRTELKSLGGIGYGHVLSTFVPLLRSAGLSDSTIEQILVHNPRRALSGCLSSE